MSGIKKFRRLRVQWKILLSVLVVLGAFSGYMVFANADSSVTVTVKSYKTILNPGEDSNDVVADMTGRDENNIVGQDSPDNYKPTERNLKWTVSDSNVVKFIVSDSAGVKPADTADGVKSPLIRAYKAGKATLTATYYIWS